MNVPTKGGLVGMATVTGFVAGWLMALAFCQPAHSSDNGTHGVPVAEDAPLPPTEGCNPYIVINPPDLPPDASNMNGITITTNIGDVCGNWQGETQIVPSLHVPRV